MRSTFRKSILCMLLVVVVLFANLAYAENSMTDYWAYEDLVLLSDGSFDEHAPITVGTLTELLRDITGVPEEWASSSANQELSCAEAVSVIAKAFCIEQEDCVEGIDVSATSFTYADALQLLQNIISDVTDSNMNSVNTDEDFVIRNAGVMLKKAIIGGDLIVGAGVNDGEVTLDDVSVGGRLLVFGGGSNSVVVRGDSRISEVVVNKSAGDPVRVKIEGAAVVGDVTVMERSNFILNGAVTSLTINGYAAVELQGGRIVDVMIDGEDVDIDVDSSSVISKITIAANDVKISGTGVVTAIDVTEDAKSGVIIDTQGTEITVAEGAGDVTDSDGNTLVESGESGKTPGKPDTPGEDEKPGPSGR